jgi:hypothetical protein
MRRARDRMGGMRLDSMFVDTLRLFGLRVIQIRRACWLRVGSGLVAWKSVGGIFTIPAGGRAPPRLPGRCRFSAQPKGACLCTRRLRCLVAVLLLGAGFSCDEPEGRKAVTAWTEDCIPGGADRTRADPPDCAPEGDFARAGGLRSATGPLPFTLPDGVAVSEARPAPAAVSRPSPSRASSTESICARQFASKLAMKGRAGVN